MLTGTYWGKCSHVSLLALAPHIETGTTDNGKITGPQNEGQHSNCIREWGKQIYNTTEEEHKSRFQI